MVLDIDATLVEVHSENKAGTAPDLQARLRVPPDAAASRTRPAKRSPRGCGPGNAGANTIADHLGVLDDAVAQLPAEIAVGHRPGDDPGAGGAGRWWCAPTRPGARRVREGLPGAQHRLRRRRPRQRPDPHPLISQPHRLRSDDDALQQPALTQTGGRRGNGAQVAEFERREL